MVKVLIVFDGNDYQTMHEVELSLQDRVNAIRDYFFNKENMKGPLAVCYTIDVEEEKWQKVKGNPKMSELIGKNLNKVRFKVLKLQHAMQECKCTGCQHAASQRPVKSFTEETCGVIKNTLPVAGLVTCVTLLGLGVLALDVWVVKNKPFCDDDDGSSHRKACWSEWTLIGAEVGALMLIFATCCFASFMKPCCSDSDLQDQND